MTLIENNNAIWNCPEILSAALTTTCSWYYITDYPLALPLCLSITHKHSGHSDSHPPVRYTLVRITVHTHASRTQGCVIAGQNKQWRFAWLKIPQGNLLCLSVWSLMHVDHRDLCSAAHLSRQDQIWQSIELMFNGWRVIRGKEWSKKRAIRELWEIKMNVSKVPLLI